jgi:hypothetical protein
MGLSNPSTNVKVNGRSKSSWDTDSERSGQISLLAHADR